MRNVLWGAIVSRFISHDPAYTDEIQSAAEAFVQSPAYDVLVEQCGFGTMASEADMPIYHGRQSAAMQIAEMANMPKREVLQKAARQTADLRQNDGA